MAVLTDQFKTNDLWRPLPRFLTVGFLSTLVDIVLFTAFHVGAGLPILLANTLSYSAGTINGFVLHRRWTFAERTPKAVGKQFSRFAIVSLTALVLNNFFVFLLSYPLETAAHSEYGDLIAKLTATAIVVGWNYIANNAWTFSPKAR